MSGGHGKSGAKLDLEPKPSHLKPEMDRLLSCEICGQRDGMVTEEDMKTHMFLEHEEMGPSCPLCNLCELTLEELQLHMNTAHEDVLSPGTSKMKSSSKMTPYSGNNPMKRPKPKMAAVFPNHSEGITNGFTDNHATPSNYNKSKLKTQDIEQSDINFEKTCSSSDYPLQLRQPDDDDDFNSNLNNDKSHSDPSRKTHKESVEMSSSGLDGSMLLISDSEEDNISVPGSSTDSPIIKRARNGTLNSAISDISSTSTEGEQKEVHKSPFRRLLETLTPNKMGERNGSKNSSGIWTDSDDLSSDIMSQEDAIGQRSDNAEGKPECPFCGMWGLDPDAMSQHVDNEHNDLLSPINNNTISRSNQGASKKPGPKPTLLSLSQTAKKVESAILCPICGLGSYDPDFLRAHISAEHPELGTSPSTAKGINSNISGRPNGAEATPRTSDSSCPMCGLEGLTETALADHVEGHFVENASREQERLCNEDDRIARELAEKERQLQEKREQEEFKKLQAQYGMDGSSGYQEQSESALEKAVARGQISVADYHEQRGRVRKVVATGMDDCRSRTQGLIDRIEAFYSKDNRNVSYGRVCGDMDHFGATPGDRGWGCGYRNLQMLLSGMLKDPTYKNVVFNGRDAMPAIGKLQQLIEAAWEQGWDPQGREQLGGAVCNTNKWIGATEVVAMLSYLRAKYVLVDFHRPTGPKGTHPKMFEWVQDYFGQPGGRLFNRGNQIKTNKLPLYLQHQGHSRTIVGYEVLKDNSIRLLIFDPSMSYDDMQGLKHNELNAQTMRPIRKSLAQMKAKQYQVVGVTGIHGSDREHRESKLIRSQRIP